jgi:hypothetical protein
MRPNLHTLRAGFLLVASAATLFTCPTHALATSILALSESEMTQRADVVALGSVVSTRVVQTQGRVNTLTTFQVHKGIKGAQDGSTLTVSVPGGDIGNLRVSVSGAPRFRAGDMFIGFFQRHNDVVFPMGLSAGVVNITGDWSTQRNLDNLDLLRGPPHNLPKGTVALYGEPATALIKRLQNTVAAQARGGH